MVRTIPLDITDARSVHLVEGDFWVAGGDGVIRFDSTGVMMASHPALRGAELIGDRAGRPLLRHESGLASIDPGSDSLFVAAGPENSDAIIFDPLGRFIYNSSESGAITAYDPATLLPLWGWGSVGGTTEGVAVAAEGHRMYQAVNPDEGTPALLVRDLQTGRILREIELDDPVRAMVTSASGAIYTLGGEGEGAVVAAYRWSEGVPVEAWRRPLPGIEPSSASRLRIGLSGQLLAVLSPENEEGLHILDAETGELIAQSRGPARDVAFGSGGRVFLLLADEIRQLEVDQ